MANRQYIGARYVPILMGEWDKTLTYEALSIVTYKGNSFTSKKPVPQGIEINNAEYWVNTGNYNAQVNEFINKVNGLTTEVNGLTTEVNGLTTEVNEINQSLEWKSFDGVTGGHFLSLPNDFSEAIALVAVDEESVRLTIPFLKGQVKPSGSTYFDGGYYLNSTSFARVNIQVTATYDVTLASCWYNSQTNIANQTYFNLYYR